MTDSKEKDIIYNETIKAGKRIYYMDVKQSRNGDRYISITESKKIVDDTNAENPLFTFEKHKIFLYKEDYAKFTEALNKVIAFASNSSNNETQPAEPERPHLLSDADLNIDINF